MINHHSAQLHPGKDKPVRMGHPWIFSGAIKSEPSNASPGDLIDVLDSQKNFLARGYYNPKSQIRIRVLTRDPMEMINADFLRARMQQSIARRAHLLSTGITTGVRLIAHESDRLPGLIVDRYGDWLSFQIVTAGMERWRSEIIVALKELVNPAGIIERSDDGVREKEGLDLRTEVVLGALPENGVMFLENGMKLLADLKQGHKTGFYLDQRDSRRIIGQYSRDLSILNCFSFTGGFSVSAMRAGASQVTNVDESQPALNIARWNLENNGIATKDSDFVRADVFKYLRELRAQGTQFDMIILDPPKFVTSSAQVDRACRGYKDLNILGMQLLKPNGLLATFSCSGLLSRDLFQKVIFGASHDANVEMQIVQHLHQAEDHPTLLSFPESLYLKGFLLRKL